MADNVTPFPRFNLGDVAEGLRRLADEIDAGDRQATRIIVCMEADKGFIDYFACGRDFPRSHAIGLCERIKAEILRE